MSKISTYKDKKSFSIIIAIIFIIVLLPINAFSGSDIVECPDIRIVINGKVEKFDDVVISKNGRTLLPLRALLVSLGVQNDNEHIVWDGLGKSVTIYKDSTRINLKQGDTNALVNDIPVKLDTEAIGYSKNGRTYIPVRFVAQALGYKVSWDGSTKTVFICNENMYNKNKEIINNVISTMKTIKKMSFGHSYYNIHFYSDNNICNSGLGIISNRYVDKNKKLLYEAIEVDYNLNGSGDISEMLLVNNMAYEKSNGSEKWSPMSLTEEEIESIWHSFDIGSLIKLDDTTYCGLIASDDEENNQIILKGDFFAGKIKPQIAGNDYFKSVGTELAINKDNGCLKSIRLIYHIAASNSDKQEYYDLLNHYGDYDGNFEIIIPDEIK